MRAAVPAAAVAVGTVMLVSGCGGSSTPGVSASAGGVSASAGASGSLAGPCKNIEQTVKSIPGRLQQAATSKQPTKTVPQALKNIDQQLMNEAGNATGDLKSAVQSYVAKLKQVANTVSNGNQPDLSKLDHSQIDNVCTNGSGLNVTVSPSTPSTSSS